jgi:hypothetical protein
MSRYRQMRRQARQARRAGMQPMMFVGNGDQLPDLAIVIILRWAVRYRSELAPVGVALLLMVFGWYAHVALFHGWWLIMLISGIAAWALGSFGAKIGIPTLLERLYVAGIVLACGTWLTLATAMGPLTSPLPLALAIGALVLAVPWWANRRRRAKVRVERTIAVWPDIARAIGLTGSQITSATIDLWGWRARMRLARGQTIADVIAKIPGIESGFGTHRNAIRVYPTPDDLANRCELRVLDRDPHADAIPWRGPTVTSITQPIDLGPFEDAEECRVLFLRRHAIVGGATGSGKSGGLNELIANLAACGDVVIWAIDLKRGMELKPWAPCIDRLATTPEQAAALLADAVTILFARAEWLADHGRREWEPAPDMPALVIIIDEYAELAKDVPSAIGDTDTIARLGRAPAVTLVLATQRPTQKVMGEGSAVRSQMNIRIAFRVEEQRDVDLILGQGRLKAGWHADKLDAPGKFLIWAPEHTGPRRARAYLVTDDDVTRTVAEYADNRPPLDPVSRGARQQPDPRQPGRTPWYLANPHADTDEPGTRDPAPDTPTLEDALWSALHAAPDDGADIGDLMRATGMGRSTLYRYLNQFAQDGRAEQVGWGRWRAITNPGDGDDE